MADYSNLKYKTQNLSMYFQGGIRRSILIFAGICIVLLVPFYFIGQILAGFWSTAKINPEALNYKNTYIPKELIINNFVVGRSQTLPLANGETVLYATINNQNNALIGYDPLIYRLQVLDEQDSVLFEELVTDYLLPGEISYIIANPKSDQGFELRIVQEKSQAVLYNPFKNDVARNVDIEIRNPVVVESETDSGLLELKASIKNNSLLNVSVIDILYLIRDTRGKVAGIGSRRLTDLKALEQRDFFQTYPMPKFKRAQSLDIRYRINYLSEDVVKI